MCCASCCHLDAVLLSRFNRFGLAPSRHGKANEAASNFTASSACHFRFVRSFIVRIIEEFRDGVSYVVERTSRIICYLDLLTSELVHSIHRKTTSCTTPRSNAALYEQKMTSLFRISSSTVVCYSQLHWTMVFLSREPFVHIRCFSAWPFTW